MITGLILAGGRGSRMGGVDKGLQPFRGRPMVAHVIERLQPQVGELLVNANQNLDTYAALGYPVVADDLSGFAGPLAGFERGLAQARGELMVTAPCDSPLLPLDLVARLQAALVREESELAVVRTGDQPHPVFCLMRVAVLPSLRAFLARGERKIDKWYAQLMVSEVDFGDEALAFRNVNTLAELQALE